MPTDPDCVFCKIVAGDLPSHRLYEDDRVLAFLDAGPLSEGHTLVIPKGHYLTLDQVPPDDAAAVGALLPKLSRAITHATGAPDWNVLQNNGPAAGQVVPHVHFHLIPRPVGSARDGEIPGNGLPLAWPAGQVDHTAATDLATLIRDAL